MSFQAYLDNIETNTGKNPDDFIVHADAQGWLTDGALRPDRKVGGIVADLKRDFGLGHGHAMAIVAYLKGKRQ